MKKTLIFLAVALIILMVAINQRHRIIFSFMAAGEPPPLIDAIDEGPEATWVDDYFITIPLKGALPTFAIGEPLYAQQNFSYLITGKERAVLFDAGPGYRDIRAVAESLTDLPITFIPSHFHYDHTGNKVTFDHVAVIDLPHIRSRAPDNRLQLTWTEHLGTNEGVAAPILEIDEWLSPNQIIDLGGREIKVLYTPGHTTDSVSLLDVRSQFLFSGDYLYPGPLYGFLPNSSLGDYLWATHNVQENVARNAILLGAHRSAGPGLPTLTMQDVNALQEALTAIKSGEAVSTEDYPVVYQVNEQIVLLAEPTWLQSWELTYPANP
jgi:hydroxyacylglutathione hydrolase